RALRARALSRNTSMSVRKPHRQRALPALWVYTKCYSTLARFARALLCAKYRRRELRKSIPHYELDMSFSSGYDNGRDGELYEHRRIVTSAPARPLAKLRPSRAIRLADSAHSARFG